MNRDQAGGIMDAEAAGPGPVRRVTAKFRCNAVESYEDESKTAKLSPVTNGSGENRDFTRYTPTGNLEIGISGEAPARHFFEPGTEYYLDFTKAE